MRNIYLLKDLAKRSGFSTHTLKYYLNLGLIEEIGRSPETQFRYFDDTTVLRLKRIKNLKARKVALQDIIGYFKSKRNHQPSP